MSTPVEQMRALAVLADYATTAGLLHTPFSICRPD